MKQNITFTLNKQHLEKSFKFNQKNVTLVLIFFYYILCKIEEHSYHQRKKKHFPFLTIAVINNTSHHKIFLFKH